MKKVIFLLLFYIFSLNAKVQIVTTTTDLKFFAEEIGGENVEVFSMIRGIDDPHFVMTRPDFLTKLNQADVFCVVGLDLEIGWVPLLQQQSRNIKIQKGQLGYCDASSGVKILGEPSVMVDRSMGDMHIYGNPHYWLDPLNAIQMSHTITQTLKRVDPIHKDLYEDNFQTLKKKLIQLIKLESEKFLPFRGKKIAVFHDQLLYLANRFQFVANLTIEERPGVPPSSRYMEQVIQYMKAEDMKVIVRGPYHNPQYAEFVASKILNSEVIVLPVSCGGIPGTENYFKMIELSLQKIRDSIQSTENKNK